MNILTVKNLYIDYDASNVLNNISFSIKKGEYVALIGKNGTGKSTLLKTIIGLKNSSKGNVSFGNISKDKISYLEQINTKNNDFPITTYEAILSGLQKPTKLFYKKDDYKKADELLKQLSIGDIKNKRLGDISGGQKQRVLIARALIKKPEMLILDEPFSGLDTKICNEIYKILKELNTKYNITILISSHDVSKIKKEASRIIYIDDGKIQYDGKPENLEVN